MNETVVSKFRPFAWTYLVIFLIVIGYSINLLINMPHIKSEGFSSNGGPVFVAALTVGSSIFIIYRFLTTGLAIVTVTPEHILIKYPVTKKQLTIKYSDIIDLDVFKVPRSTIVSKTRYKLKIDLSNDCSIFIREVEYKNYEELKNAIYANCKRTPKTTGIVTGYYN